MIALPHRDAAGHRENRTTITGTIKGLFRQAGKAATRGEEEEPPKKRTQKEGERDGGMMRFALRFARHLTRAAHPVLGMKAARKGFTVAQAALSRSAASVDSYGAASGYLADTLAQLHQWNDETMSAGFDECCDIDQNLPTLEL